MKHGADDEGEEAGSNSSQASRRRSRWGSPIDKCADEPSRHQSGMWTCEVCDVVMAPEFKESHLSSKVHAAQSEEVLSLYRDMQQMQAGAEAGGVEAGSSDIKTAEEARESATGQPVPTVLDREKASVTIESAVRDKRNKEEGGSRKRPRWEPPPKASVATTSSPTKRNRQSDEKSAKVAKVTPSAAETHGQLDSKSAGTVSPLHTAKRWEPPAAAALPGQCTSKMKTENTTKPPKASFRQPASSSNIKMEGTAKLTNKRSQESGQSASEIKTEETAESTKARSEQPGQSASRIKTEEGLTAGAAVEPVERNQDDDNDEEGDGNDEHSPSICIAMNQPYLCLVCNIDLKTKERYATHIEGKRHKRKMEACFCTVCGVSCRSEHNYMQHLRGKKHRKKCKEIEEKLRNGGEAKEDLKKDMRDGDGKKVADLSASTKSLIKVQEDLAGKEWRTKMEIVTNESVTPLAVVKYMVARNAHTSQCKLAVCPDRLFRYRCVVTGCPKHIDVDTSGFGEHPRFFTEYLWARRRTKRGLGLLSVQAPLDYSSLNQVSKVVASVGMRSTGAQLTLIEGIRAESGQSWTDGVAAQLGDLKSALLSNPAVEIVALKAHPTTTGFGAAPVASTNATLAVFGISNGTTAAHVRAAFEPRCGGGKIMRVELRSSRGYGFIDFDSENAVTRIMQQAAAKPISLFGRPLRVQRGTSHAAPPRADASAVIVAEISLGPGPGTCRNCLLAGKDSGGPGLALPQRPLHVTLGVVLAESASAKIDQISPALIGTKLKVFARGLSVLAPTFEEKMIFERTIDRRAVTAFVRDGKEAAERLNNAISADCGTSPEAHPPVLAKIKAETKEDESGARHNKENDGDGDRGGENSVQGKYECDLSALDDSAVLAEARRYISKVVTLCARVSSVDKELSSFGF